MSIQWLIGTLAVVALAAGAWYWSVSQGSVAPPEIGLAPAGQNAPASDNTVPATNKEVQPGQEQQQAPTVAPTTGSGGSNSDLNADLQTIDAQINDASQSSDSAQTFNDQPVQQTE